MDEIKKTTSGFVWFLAGLGFGLFAALLVYLDGQPESSSNFGEAVQKELDKIKKKPEKKPAKTTNKQEPKFNFYTILPELEVLIPDSEIQPPKHDNSTTTTGSISPGKQYVLQAGSFQRKDDAEKLKASLALLGYEANVQHVTINRDDWHRVRIGPLHKHKRSVSNHQSATSAQHKRHAYGTEAGLICVTFDLFGCVLVSPRKPVAA